MVAKTSPAVLAALFKRFQRTTFAARGMKLSMREVSADLAVRDKVKEAGTVKPGTAGDPSGGAAVPTPIDQNALARWTNPKRPNWFIPLSRVQSVARSLGASQSETDALMIVRLQELAAHNPDHDVLGCGAWIAARIACSHALAADEQAVLAAYRRATAPAGCMLIFEGKRLEELEAYLKDVTQATLRDAAQDAQETEDDQVLSAAERVALRSNARAMLGTRDVAPSESAGKESSLPTRNVPRAVLVRELFKALRAGKRSAT